MIKLQKQKSYVYKDYPIFKYRINIPSDLIKKLGWEDGNIELDIVIGKNKKLEISKAITGEIEIDLCN